MYAKSKPQECGGDEPEGSIGVRPLVIASGDATELLEAVDHALDAVALPIALTVEGTRAALIHATGDGDADAMLARIAPNLAAAVAFVAHDAPRPQFRATSPDALDCALLHQGLEHRRFVLLPWGQGDDHRLAVSFAAQVHLGAETALAVA